MYSRNLYFFFISTFLYVSCQAQCDKGPNPEKTFAEDYTFNMSSINMLSAQLGCEQWEYLCNITLGAAGKFKNDIDKGSISIDPFNMDKSTPVKSEFAQDKNAITTYPAQCSIQRLQEDTRAFYCLASTNDKIYLVKMDGDNFVYQDTVCVDPGKMGTGANQPADVSQVPKPK